MKKTRKEGLDYCLVLSHKSNWTIHDQNQGLIRNMEKIIRKEYLTSSIPNQMHNPIGTTRGELLNLADGDKRMYLISKDSL